MSSDLFVLDDSSFFHHHSSNSPENEMVISSDGDLFFSQLCSTFCCDASSLDEFKPGGPDLAAPVLLSSPSHRLQSLTIGGHPAAEDGYSCDLWGDGGGGLVKTEECQMGLELESSVMMPMSYCGGENAFDEDMDAGRIMQRSYSGNAFDVRPAGGAGFFFQPLLESSPNYQSQFLSSPESEFLAGQLRRVYSTGDLQSIGRGKGTQRSLSSPLAMENSFTTTNTTEESQSSKVGRYSAEERQERISRYRAKRSQRNFNKTIKYACRKTLADNRPRIRGRFARNDESYCGENIPKGPASSSRDEDEDDLWQFDGMHEEEDEVRNRVVGGGGGEGGCFGQAAQFPHFQFYGY